MAATDLKYTAPPTVSKMMHSDADMRAIMGPIGSGKSVGCVIEIIRRCIQMPVGEGGLRRSRWAVIRNTNQQLKDTTLRTFLEWAKPGVFGRWKVSDMTFELRFNDVEADILFRPLDTAEDQNRVLSLELTGAWINEAREVPVELIGPIQGRLGRFPRAEDVPGYWTGLICDTNPPEINSAWYNIFEKIPLEEGDPNSVMECDSYTQPSGLSAEAENIEHLRPGYYDKLAIGKTKAWVDTYMRGMYSPSRLGKPVYHKVFKLEKHVSKVPLNIDPYLPIGIGFDTGLTPALVFKQMDMDGRVRVLREIAAFDMGMKRCIQMYVRPMIKNFFPTNPLLFVGDPAGVRRGDGDESSAIKELKKAFKDDGARVKTASTNNPAVRIQATEQMLDQYPGGEPLMLIDPSCKRYIEGLRSKYRYMKVKQTGNYQPVPQKNPWAHLIEAGQYIDMFFLSGKYDATDYTAEVDFDPFAHLNTYRPAIAEGGY